MRTPILQCEHCHTTVKNTSKERRRFLRRHPKLCSERKAFAKQLAQGTGAVEDEERQEVRKDV